MKVPFLIFCGWLMVLSAVAQQEPSNQYVLQRTHNAVQYKNYYLLTLLQKDLAVKTLIQKDPIFSAMLKNKKNKNTGGYKKLRY
ncbi:hypothetical protein [Pedobacter lusitanus]|uniref:hypothetical protein n=1 Tax=Pedobacter lusitanus TaxID=1503925 RepID=UPI000B2B7049|nr:hypothetical protein [Pedobacter lusitanus]